MSGISDSLIATILYATGNKAYWKFQNPLKNAIEKTIIYFNKEKGIELETKSLENLFDNQVAKTQLNAFKQGKKFLDGKELALQFAIFSGFYHEDESSIIDIANEIFEYFKTCFTNELLRNPHESIQNLNYIIGIHFDISKAEHKNIKHDLENINQELKLRLSSIDNNVKVLLQRSNEAIEQKKEYKAPVQFKKDTSVSRFTCFQSFDNFIDSGSCYSPNKKDLIKDLLYISKTEKNIFSRIKNIIKSRNSSRRIAIIEGPPASGKTILSLIIAKSLEDEEYSVHFHRVTSRSSFENIWKDLQTSGTPNNLFVFENSHLSPEILNYIYENYSSLKYVACLFLTRNISEKVRFSFELDNLDAFNALTEVTFKLNSEINDSEKVLGIIEKYKEYYEFLYNKEFIIGDTSKIIKNIRGNLLALHYYLECWHSINSLDEVDQQLIFKELYKRYLIHPNSGVLLKYAAIYQFEINIEPQEQEVVSADSLLSQGVLLYDLEKENYNFYHSDFSKLLIESFQSRPSFSRKYDDIDDFTYAQIKDYLTGFRKYPSNVHEVVYNLVSKNKSNIFRMLLSNSKTKEIIIRYYSDVRNAHNFSEFLSCVFITDKFSVNDFAQILITSPKVEESFFKRNIFNFANIVTILYKTDQKISESYLQKFSDKDLMNLVLSSSLSAVTTSISLLNKYQKLKSKIENFITPEYLIQESEKIGFRSISIYFAFLSKSCSKVVFKALKSISSQYLAKSTEDEFLGDIATGLVTLQNIDANKARDIYLRIPDKIIIDRAENIGCTFTGLTNGLFNLSKIDFPKTRSVAKRISFQSLLEKAQDPSNGFMKIIDGLTFLNRFSRNKFEMLLSKIDLRKLFELAIQENAFTTFQRLNQLNKINVQAARSLSKNIDIQPVVASIENDQFSINSFGKLLSELNNVHMEKSWSILDKIKTETLFNKLKEDHISINALGQTISIFRKVYPRKAHAVLKRFTALDLVYKSQNGKFTGIALGLTSLYKIDKDKIRFCLSEFDDLFFKEKAEKAYLSFGAVVKGLSFLRGIDHEFSAKVYKSINEDIIGEKLRKVRLNKHIMKQKEILLTLDKERTIRIFKEN